ncbi:hypothetical protein F5888DRAFT_681598 [Russula emetica]|nr:hypothetical protein F5888DRAFT_681598 [Russula emetica]
MLQAGCSVCLERYFQHYGSRFVQTSEAVLQVFLQERFHETLCPYASTYLTVQRSRPKMIPLMPTVALALFSVICSAFVILRVLLSTLPQPRPLGRRVYPLTFSRLSSSSLPSAGKSYVWLALSDILAVAVFVWEAFGQWFDSSSQSSRVTSRSAARLWLALTFRQTCFLIISALILIHVRRRKSVSFGRAHSYLWVPVLFIASVSTVAAGLIADRIPGSFLIGYIVYSSTTAILNTVIFGSLVGGLIIIKRSLASFELEQARKDSSKSVDETPAEKPPQLTLDIEAVREGSLWITSTGSSHRRDEPNYPYSYSTTRNIAVSPDQATPPRSAVGPPQGTHSSTSSRNPSLRRDDIHANDFGYAPFRNRTQSLRAAAAAAAALTVSSQGSWISSSLGTRPTLSAWSYPTQRSSPPSRAQSVVEDAIGLASDHRAPSAPQAERGTTSPSSAAARSQEIEVSTLRILAWLAGVWAPLVLSLPYLTRLNSTNLQSNESTSTFLVISVTISSPILVLNSLLRHPIPIPYDMFDAPPAPRSVLRYAPSMMNSASTLAFGGYYRRASGMGLVTGRPPCDIKDGVVDLDEKGHRMPFPRKLSPARQRRLSILSMDNAKGPSSQSSRNWHNVPVTMPVQGHAAPVHWYLPSPPAPTRVDSDSRRHSSIHPNDYITPGQHITHTNGRARVIRPTKSVSFRRL